MKTCKYCIHYNCCCEWTSKETMDSVSPDLECRAFKDAENVVEVCRCKDCEFARKDPEAPDLYGCTMYRDMRKGNDYCNYGARKEQK